MIILLVDDHQMVRYGLKQILKEAYPTAEFREASNANDLFQELADGACNLVLLDLSLPGRSGLDALAEIKQKAPRLPVLAVSGQPEEEYAARCLKAGASGYLNKSSTPESLVGAVKKILAGGRYISSEFAETMAMQLSSPRCRATHEELSDREFEVFLMLVRGLALKEIGKELKISGKTVSTYRNRILGKMQMKSNSDLVRYAIQNQIIG